MHIIWAYGNTDIIDDRNFAIHSSKGWSSEKVIMVPGQPVPVPVHFANVLSFNNGNYKASWTYNSGTDMLHFIVEVRATGWIGLGVATRAPNNMVGYDVAVGGVTGGAGYLQVRIFLLFFICRSYDSSPYRWL